MGHGSDKMYITALEHASGEHSASSTGKQYGASYFKSEIQRLPFDSCALSLQPFKNPVAVIAKTIPTKSEQAPVVRADVFDLLNIVPYIRKFKTNPVTGEPLETGQLLKLNFFKNGDGNYHDPVTFKLLSNHTHIVFLKTTGNVYDYQSIVRLAIKTKSWRDLVTEEPFTREDIVTIQDPENLGARDLSQYDYVKSAKKVDDSDLANDPLRNINLEAMGGAGKVLKMLAEKSKAATPTPQPAKSSKAKDEPSEEKTGVVASFEKAKRHMHASNFTDGAASAAFTSTGLMPQKSSKTHMFDEEEYMFAEFLKPMKDKDRLKHKGYATIMTNFGGLNLELHADRAPKTVYNFIMLAKEGKYDDVSFHRLIPGFMIQGGDPTGTGSGGKSYWGEPFRDEYEEKGALTHEARGVLSMANSGPNSNTSQFFLTFRKTPHLDYKHTVFGKLVGGEDTLNTIEAQPVLKGDKPAGKGIKILSVQVLTDPFEEYRQKVDERLARTNQTEEQLQKKAQARAAREKDRTTWLGTDLGVKGAPKQPTAQEQNAGVGKYLGAVSGGKRAAPPVEFGLEKKKKKGGGFGDFSGW